MGNNKPVIGVSLFTRKLSFHQELEKGLEEEAKKQGYELLLDSAEYDAGKQEEQVESFISKKVGAIVICPADSLSIGKTIEKANQANIPVFTADTSNLSEQGKVVSHIASDNIQGGKLGARLIARAIKYNGKVIELTHPSITSCIDRDKGFKEGIIEFPDVELIKELPVPVERADVENIIKEYLESNSEVNGIFTVSDETALGALAVIEALGKNDTIKIVGYDAIMEVRSAISEGKIYADVRQFPIKIGQETIKIIDEFFEGIHIPPVVNVEIGSWT